MIKNTVDHIQGYTFHGRKGEVENAFRYSIDYVLLSPDECRSMPALFSRNRRNVTSLFDSDHGGAPKAGQGVTWVQDVLSTFELAGAEDIRLLAQPRFWGHVFNPVSFWLCYDVDQQLCTVIAEVSNTFGDRHSYLCHRDDKGAIEPTDVLKARKIFYVSPFQEVDGGYEFRFDIDAEKIGIWINYTNGKQGLVATLVGKRKPMTNASILWAALRRPLGSRRVLALIHWQALKLWWKGARYKTRPEPPATDLSR